MAEKVALQKLEDELQCTICLDTYTDPKVLQCDHVYCRECLRQLLLRNMSGDHSLTCPSCRQVTPVPENGVQDLKPAFKINRLLDIQGSYKRKAEKISYCREHADEELKLYCKTCKKRICFNCVVEGARHHGCEYDKLNAVYDKYKEEVIEPTKENLLAIKKALQKNESSQEEISSQCADVEANIQNTFDQLSVILEERRNNLVTQLHQLTQGKLKLLAIQQDRIIAMQEELQHCVEERVETKSSCELIGAKTIDSNAVFQPDILIPTTTADIKFTASMEDMKEYGILSAKEMMPDPNKCCATGSGLDTVMVGETAKVVVQTINYWGEPCVMPNQSVTGIIDPEITGPLKNLHVKLIKPSHYEMNITPEIKGRHYLHIKIGDQEICGSPFSILVKAPRTIGTLLSTISDVHKPWRIVINHKGQIVVIEHDKHCISVLSVDGEKIRSFGSHGSNEGQFNHPRGVAVDEKDNILVCDYKNNRIQKFTSDGEFLAAVGTKGNKQLQFKGPSGIAFNTFNKMVYIVDDHRVQILGSDLTFCGEFEGRNLGFDIECDRYGRVYVLSAKIQVFSADGNFLNVIGNFSSLADLHSIAIDNDDNVLYVNNYVTGCIYSFTLEGEVVDSFSTVILRTKGIAVDSGVVYVCDYFYNSIKIF